jgi:hypothetical protein
MQAMVIKRSHANISPCGVYRYTLSRPPEAEYDAPALVVIMLNPSTADASANDATINRLRAFTRAWGRGGFVVWNLYAYRSKNPHDLRLTPDPVGPDNDYWLHALLTKDGVSHVLCAWGAGALPLRVREVVNVLQRTDTKMLCLGVTADGSPRHPLYVLGDTKLEIWKPNCF